MLPNRTTGGRGRTAGKAARASRQNRIASVVPRPAVPPASKTIAGDRDQERFARRNGMTIALTVNGKAVSVNAEPNTPLLWVLREHLKLTGTKFGCGSGLCGACTVHVDGKAVRSCQTAVSQVQDKKVTTIEGLSPSSSHPLQKAWIAEQVPQCGYCQSGQIMQAAELLAATRNPTREQIVAHMDGNICRCGTYQRIVRAIERAAREA